MVGVGSSALRFGKELRTVVLFEECLNCAIHRHFLELPGISPNKHLRTRSFEITLAKVDLMAVLG
jgi:hypothetical protein